MGRELNIKEIDDKGRIVIPKPMRDRLGDTYHVELKEEQKCIVLKSVNVKTRGPDGL